jgi:hypothetical protein
LIFFYSGFEYCVNQTLGGWCPTEKIFHLNRRRRWYRTRIIQVDKTPQDKKVIRISFESFDRIEKSFFKNNLLLFETSDETTSLLNGTEVGFRFPLDC